MPDSPAPAPVPAERTARGELRLGLLLGVGAYALWGLFPLYFPLLEPASPLEVLAHRFVWSFLFLMLVMLVTRSWARMTWKTATSGYEVTTYGNGVKCTFSTFASNVATPGPATGASVVSAGTRVGAVDRHGGDDGVHA